MKNYIKMGILSFLLGFTACQKPAAKLESVRAEQFSKVIAEEGVQILDVRTADEYAEGHIQHSKNIDVTADGFAEKAKSVLNKEKTVALYCRSGRRSKKAADILNREGFKVVELGGGFNEWKEAHYEIEK